MVIKSAELEKVCGPASGLPESSLPQVAFAGRSNVGKSSLINTLVNRKALARTSGQPGKTQTINFYNINGEFYFVDLPGYGYARAPRQKQEEWGRLIERYLYNEKQLRAVFLLVDIRHEAKAADKMMYEWIEAAGLRPVVIATKADKISRGAAAKNLKLLRDGLGLKKGTVLIPFSSVSRAGRDDVLTAVDEILA